MNRFDFVILPFSISNLNFPLFLYIFFFIWSAATSICGMQVGRAAHTDSEAGRPADRQAHA